MTLRELYQEGAAALRQYGVPDAELDARLLLLDAFEMSTAEYLGAEGKELSSLYEQQEYGQRVAQYESLLNERASRRPLQQILGSTQFMGLEFAVNENVLIPRQDTETLVETVLADFPQKDIRVLDMCTGSGCIAISLFVLGGYDEVVGADLSREALYVAKENGERLSQEAKEREGAAEQGFFDRLFGRQSARSDSEYEQKLHFVQTDLFRGMPEALETLGFEQFDVIVSNPPYIRSADIEGLAPEVRDFEPRMALDGSEDGLHFYRRIAKEAKPYLREGGALYLEIGADEGQAVRDILKDAGFVKIDIVKDLPGKDRVVRAHRRHAAHAGAPKARSN